MSFELKGIPKVSRKRALITLFRYASPFLIFVFFLAFAYGLFTWYDETHRSEWTAAEKDAYAEEAFHDAVFREDRFRDVLRLGDEREARHATTSPVARDIFLFVRDR